MAHSLGKQKQIKWFDLDWMYILINQLASIYAQALGTSDMAQNFYPLIQVFIRYYYEKRNDIFHFF